MWVYKQSTGQLFDENDACVATGYSGALDAKNIPSKQCVAEHGPIPRGVYMITAPFPSTTHGPYCLRLVANTDNVMFGRSGFLMHGDSKEHPGAASQGCIIMSRTARQAVWESGDHRLTVVE